MWALLAKIRCPCFGNREANSKMVSAPNDPQSSICQSQGSGGPSPPVKSMVFGRKHVIFGRPDLRISLSGAKFDAEADFDVRFSVDRPNPCRINRKQNFSSENFAENVFSASKMKRRELSETRFGKVLSRSESSLIRTRLFKVLKLTLKKWQTTIASNYYEKMLGL